LPSTLIALTAAALLDLTQKALPAARTRSSDSDGTGALPVTSPSASSVWSRSRAGRWRRRPFTAREQVDQLGRLAHDQHQHAGGHRVERASVADVRVPSTRRDHRDRIVRGGTPALSTTRRRGAHSGARRHSLDLAQERLHLGAAIDALVIVEAQIGREAQLQPLRELAPQEALGALQALQQRLLALRARLEGQTRT
jgi:hypothetical protein